MEMTFLHRAGKISNMKNLFIFSLVVLLTGCAALSNKKREAVRHEVAVAYMNLDTGEMLAYNGYTLFHAASTMKTPVMFQLFRMRDLGIHSLSDPVPVINEFESIVDGSLYKIPMSSAEDEPLYPYLNKAIPMSSLIEAMIIYSSNLATNILVKIARPEDISETLTAMGASGVLVLRGVEDIKAYELGLSNQTSALGMLKVMEGVYRSDLVADSSNAQMLAILKAQKYNSMIPAGLPEDVEVAHKTGSITHIAHDAAIVFPPQASPYVLVILTRGWDKHSEASKVGARITKTVHRMHLGEIKAEDIVIPDLMK